METRLPATSVNLSSNASTPRVTPTQPSVPFAQVMGQTAVLGAETAMRALPGGPLMAAALRSGAPAVPMSAPASSLGTTGQALSASGSLGPTAPTTMNAGPRTSLATTTSASAEGPGAVAPSGGPGGAMNVDSALAQSQEMNLYYLRIQEQVNAENRSFTTMSNVVKAEHETVKTAIGNIR